MNHRLLVVAIATVAAAGCSTSHGVDMGGPERVPDVTCESLDQAEHRLAAVQYHGQPAFAVTAYEQDTLRVVSPAQDGLWTVGTMARSIPSTTLPATTPPPAPTPVPLPIYLGVFHGPCRP